MNPSYELTQLINDALSGDKSSFRPCAFYDDRLDCIRVVAKDCSVLEERLNERITILVDRYAAAGNEKYVGFTIKGAQHFCQERGLKLSTSLTVTQVGDALLKSFPDPAVMMFVDLIVKSLVEEYQLGEIEFVPDDSQLVPA